jgi:adenine-specific DNA-methyltransferase
MSTKPLTKSDDKPPEPFGLSWPGKSQALQLAALPTRAGLQPAPGEGAREAVTENIFIEGDNLDVLKLLHKSHAKRIKMIYIDPPYNTGNNYIYSDDYSEPTQSYLSRTSPTNGNTDGRFHANWLSMMYPRLLLARSLLTDDGVIFVSIDDNEAHHLRLLLNEIFGAENYLTTLYVQVRYADKTLVEDADFHKLVEQVIVYGNSLSARLNRPSAEYSFHKFVWQVVEKAPPAKTLELGGKKVEVFDAGSYSIRKAEPSPENLKEIWASGKILDGNSSGRFFRDYLANRAGVDQLGSLYKVYGMGDDSYAFRYFTGPKRASATKGKYYQGVPLEVINSSAAVQRAQPISNFYNFADAFGNCRHEGGVDFRSGKKPIAFIKTLLKLGTTREPSDIVLDFFAGSCSTAHAVLDLNREDNGRRRFICVQRPEPADNNEFANIAELGKSRIRHVVRSIPDDKERENADLGFKVLRVIHGD